MSRMMVEILLAMQKERVNTSGGNTSAGVTDAREKAYSCEHYYHYLGSGKSIVAGKIALKGADKKLP
ncbi:AIF_collapsed_G0031920.mRNA.1.CDS.1 [Saccharomyces cerevisiae]|nr:AIF_collapsed_G0031920.mRNA.1.CDS.1 [Saccharomyces cerevisiae]